MIFEKVECPNDSIQQTLMYLILSRHTQHLHHYFRQLETYIQVEVKGIL